jgi:hypothetical protein
MPLRDLPMAHYEEYTTLVIPPLGELRSDPVRNGEISDAALSIPSA